MRKLLAAFGFLTILPTPGSSNCTAETICASGAMFPLVGIVIGGAMGALAWLAALVWPQQVTALIVVALGWGVLSAVIGLPIVVVLLGGVCLGGAVMFGLSFWYNR